MSNDNHVNYVALFNFHSYVFEQWAWIIASFNVLLMFSVLHEMYVDRSTRFGWDRALCTLAPPMLTVAQFALSLSLALGNSASLGEVVLVDFLHEAAFVALLFLFAFFLSQQTDPKTGALLKPRFDPFMARCFVAAFALPDLALRTFGLYNTLSKGNSLTADGMLFAAAFSALLATGFVSVWALICTAQHKALEPLLIPAVALFVRALLGLRTHDNVALRCDGVLDGWSFFALGTELMSAVILVIAACSHDTLPQAPDDHRERSDFAMDFWDADKPGRGD